MTYWIREKRCAGFMGKKLCREMRKLDDRLPRFSHFEGALYVSAKTCYGTEVGDAAPYECTENGHRLVGDGVLDIPAGGSAITIRLMQIRTAFPLISHRCAHR